MADHSVKARVNYLTHPKTHQLLTSVRVWLVLRVNKLSFSVGLLRTWERWIVSNVCFKNRRVLNAAKAWFLEMYRFEKHLFKNPTILSHGTNPCGDCAFFCAYFSSSLTIWISPMESGRPSHECAPLLIYTYSKTHRFRIKCRRTTNCGAMSDWTIGMCICS